MADKEKIVKKPAAPKKLEKKELEEELDEMSELSKAKPVKCDNRGRPVKGGQIKLGACQTQWFLEKGPYYDSALMKARIKANRSGKKMVIMGVDEMGKKKELATVSPDLYDLILLHRKIWFRLFLC